MSVGFSIGPLPPLSSLESMWRNLEHRAKPNFMLSWTWIGPWLQCVDYERYLVTGQRDGKIVFLAILSPNMEVRSKKLIKSKQLVFHRTGVPELDCMTPEYNGFLIDTAFEIEAVEAFGIFIQNDPAVVQHTGKWEELMVYFAAPHAVDTLDFKGLVRTEAIEHPAYGTDLVSVRTSGKKYLDTLSKNTRQQIRRSMRLYAEKGELQLERATNLEEALDWWTEAGDFHRARWDDMGGSSYDLPLFVAFHRALITEAWSRGEVELVKVTAGDHHIGTLYNFIMDGEVLFYLSALRFEENSKLKPGLVTHAMCIQSHVDAGNRLYNMLAGYKRYKASLGDELRPFVTLRFSKPKLKFKLEQLAKDTLGIE